MTEWSELGGVLLRIAAAYLLALPIGWQRERSSRGLGLRTFPLVSVASCTYVLLSMGIAAGDANAEARILAGLITGIGFIGGGAILKRTSEEEIHGTSTAAGIWATGALGAAAAYGRWDLALVVSLVTLATFRLLEPVKERLDGHHHHREAD